MTAALAPYLWMTNTTWYDPVRNTASFLILQRPPRSALAGLEARFGPASQLYLVDGCTVVPGPGTCCGASQGTTMTGQRALRASQLGTEPNR